MGRSGRLDVAVRKQMLHMTYARVCDLLRDAHPEIQVQLRNGSLWLQCPLGTHVDATPSMKVDFKEGAWLYKCFGCNAGGNFKSLWRGTLQMGEFPDFEEKQAAPAPVETAAEPETPEQPEEISSESEADIMLVGRWNSSLEGSPGQKYLEKRKLDTKVSVDNGVGYTTTNPYCGSKNSLRGEGWLTFPEIRNGVLLGVKFRSVVSKKTPSGDSGFTSRLCNGHKFAVWGLSRVQAGQPVYITEGEMDAIALLQTGHIAVSFNGTSAYSSVSKEELDVLATASERILAGDSDGPGVAGMEVLLKKFKTMGLQNNHLVRWERGHKDANSFLLSFEEPNDFILAFHRLVDVVRSTIATGIVNAQVYFSPEASEDALLSERLMRFPWAAIDSRVKISPGELAFLFGRETKVGKSSWVQQLMFYNAIERNKKVVYYSAEVPPALFRGRACALLTGADRSELFPSQLAFIHELLGKHRYYHGYFPGQTFDQVIANFEDAMVRDPADIFVLDPLHFLVRSVENEVGAISVAMKRCVNFAVSHGIILWVVGQARKRERGAENRLTEAQDARSSATIAEDSSTVWILDRNRSQTSVSDVKSSTSDDHGAAGEVMAAHTIVSLDHSRNSESGRFHQMFRGRECRFDSCTNDGSPVGGDWSPTKQFFDWVANRLNGSGTEREAVITDIQNGMFKNSTDGQTAAKDAGYEGPFSKKSVENNTTERVEDDD